MIKKNCAKSNQKDNQIQNRSNNVNSNLPFEKTAIKVSNVSIFGNIALSVVKLLAGIIAHSSAMVSDAVHSASDVFSSIIVIIGLSLRQGIRITNIHTVMKGLNQLQA